MYFFVGITSLCQIYKLFFFLHWQNVVQTCPWGIWNVIVGNEFLLTFFFTKIYKKLSSLLIIHTQVSSLCRLVNYVYNQIYTHMKYFHSLWTALHWSINSLLFCFLCKVKETLDLPHSQLWTILFMVHMCCLIWLVYDKLEFIFFMTFEYGNGDFTRKFKEKVVPCFFCNYKL